MRESWFDRLTPLQQVALACVTVPLGFLLLCALALVAGGVR